ncbi:MAG: hypothetical protein H6977_19040 [Gammaproteobacteria bacterium]|nr:hypothetical protein [Gammaproteobacteria bacterium]
MNALGLVLSLLIAAAGALCVVQLWYPVLSAATFVKVLATLGVAVVVIGVIALMRRELREESRLRDDGFLD